MRTRVSQPLRGLPALFFTGAIILLLSFHKRAGVADAGGPDLLRLLLRADLWMVLYLVATLLFRPRDFRRPRCSRAAAIALYWAPAVAVGAALIGSVVGFESFGIGLNSFGAQMFLRMLLGWVFGLALLSHLEESRALERRLQLILLWAPLGSILIGAWFLISPGSLGMILGGNWIAEGDGVLSFGGRFQGLTSNPNMVATGCTIAFGVLLPRLARGRWMLAGYASLLIGVIIWSGVRASLLCLALLSVVYVWLRFRATSRRLKRLALVAVGLLVFMGGALWALSHTRFGAVMAERLQGGDGRLFLWRYYLGVLAQNPLGLGLGFESIVHTDQIIPGQRLPPHNTFLEMAMYGGWLGVVSHLMVFGACAKVLLRLRRRSSIHPNDVGLQGTVLAWIAVAFSLMFAGLIFVDFLFITLSVLLLRKDASIRQAGAAEQAKNQI